MSDSSRPKATRQHMLAGFEPETPSQPTKSDQIQPAAVSNPAGKSAGDAALQPPEAPPESLAGQKVYVVDSHSLIYQVFHALPEMTGPSGQPVGATHGFTRDMVDLLENKRPDYLFCAFDHPGETFRHQLYDKYKENREAMPPDLRPQIADIRRMLTALGIAALDCDGYEADDILATIARQVDALGGECYLVTGDKDCRQLLSDRVRIYNIRKDQLYDADDLAKDWNVRPDQVVDFQALVGDSSDNIPGVPLIGPKIAGQLLNEYQTLQGVLDNADQISGAKRKQNLTDHREMALLSRRLAHLAEDTPVEIDWRAGRVGGIDTEQVARLCDEFGFRRLADRLAGLTVQEAPRQWQADYRCIETAEQLAELVEEMSRQQRISVDTETTSTNPRWAEIVGYSFSYNEGQACYVPVRAPEGEPQLDPDKTLAALKPVLEDERIEKVGQNLKYDMVVLRAAGVELQGAAIDTMVADYLLDPGQRNHTLDDLAKRYLNHTTIKISELIGTGKKQKRMDEVPLEQVVPYAAEDADIPFRLAGILRKRLEEENLDRLFDELEMPLVEVLVEMEFNGIRIDTQLLGRLSQRYAARLDELVKEIYEIAGHEFNIDSRLQLAKVLFEELELPVVKRTKTGPSTDVEVLTELARQHPLPAKIIEYRQHAKLKSTYIDALPELVHPQTGRVHTSLKQDVAATGRLSSKEPNLQNIPIRTAEGREIRSAFTAGRPDWRLLAADYSQIELRVLAHFSQDEALCQAFRDDHDIHRLVAAEVYGVTSDDVTSEMRRAAKAINFGIIYGQSAFGLAKALDIDKDEAAAFIDAYFERYEGVEEFMNGILEECLRTGYVSTMSGRRRAIQGVRPAEQRGDSRQRNLPERMAINTVIQGSAADLIKRAMINVHRRLRREQSPALLLLQIHDELLLEAPPEEIEPLARLVVQEMTAAGELAVPLKVDVKTGLNWAECEAM